MNYKMITFCIFFIMVAVSGCGILNGTAVKTATPTGEGTELTLQMNITSCETSQDGDHVSGTWTAANGLRGTITGVSKDGAIDSFNIKLAEQMPNALTANGVGICEALGAK